MSERETGIAGEAQQRASSLAPNLKELETEAKEVLEWITLGALVEHSLSSNRRLLIEDCVRKLKMLLSSPHALHRDNVLQVLPSASIQ